MKNSSSAAARSTTMSLICVAALAAALGGCKHGDDGSRVAGWTLVDPTERHPIVVSQQPQTMSIRVARGSSGLSGQQKNEMLAFAHRWRAQDAGNSKLVIAVPSGSANETAAMSAVHEIRQILSDNGFSETAIVVEVYSNEGVAQPPIRVSYHRYVAEAPNCGQWTTNLAIDRQNLPHPNLGCTTQKNLAAMVANPADLLGPRSETDRSGERRSEQWEKYIKGETTGAEKAADEKVKVSN
jgi:pilus assembly protein CpaD